LARINIDDSLFKDNRFTDLCIALGSRRLALGAVVEAFVLAQQQVSIENPTGIVPEEKWIEQSIAPEIQRCRLAELKDGHFELVGAKEQFSWLLQRKIAALKGGEVSAGRRMERSDRAPTEADRQPESAGISRGVPEQAGANPLTPSLSLAPSPDSSTSSVSTSGELPGAQSDPAQGSADPEVKDPKKKSRSRKAPALDDPDLGLRRSTWDAYADAYIRRWSYAPARNAKTNRLVKELVQLVGADAPPLVTFYLSHSKRFYVECSHALGPCVSDYQALLTQMRRGQQITGAHLKDLEKNQEIQAAFDDANRGGY